MKILIIDSRLTKADDDYSDTQGMGGIASSVLYLSDCLAHYLDTDHARSADGIVFVSEW